MNRLLLLCALVFLPMFASAYAVSLTEVERPYENVEIGVYAGEQDVLLGRLEEYPVMYQFDIVEDQPFSMRVRQAYRSGIEPTSFSLLLVGVENDGASVYEVGRVRPGVDDWSIVEDAALGMTFYESVAFETRLATGTYRVEISTPVNEGRYALLFGSGESDAGYFATLGNIRATQKHFGYSVFKMLTSPYVFYPLGIVLLLFAFRKTWKYRRMISNVE